MADQSILPPVEEKIEIYERFDEAAAAAETGDEFPAELADDFKRVKRALRVARDQQVCYRCSKPGHLAKQCRGQPPSSYTTRFATAAGGPVQVVSAPDEALVLSGGDSMFVLPNCTGEWVPMTVARMEEFLSGDEEIMLGPIVLRNGRPVDVNHVWLQLALEEFPDAMGQAGVLAPKCMREAWQKVRTLRPRVPPSPVPRPYRCRRHGPCDGEACQACFAGTPEDAIVCTYPRFAPRRKAFTIRELQTQQFEVHVCAKLVRSDSLVRDFIVHSLSPDFNPGTCGCTVCQPWAAVERDWKLCVERLVGLGVAEVWPVEKMSFPLFDVLSVGETLTIYDVSLQKRHVAVWLGDTVTLTSVAMAIPSPDVNYERMLPKPEGAPSGDEWLAGIRPSGSTSVVQMFVETEQLMTGTFKRGVLVVSAVPVPGMVATTVVIDKWHRVSGDMFVPQPCSVVYRYDWTEANEEVPEEQTRNPLVWLKEFMGLESEQAKDLGAETVPEWFTELIQDDDEGSYRRRTLQLQIIWWLRAIVDTEHLGVTLATFYPAHVDVLDDFRKATTGSWTAAGRLFAGVGAAALGIGLEVSGMSGRRVLETLRRRASTLDAQWLPLLTSVYQARWRMSKAPQTMFALPWRQVVHRCRVPCEFCTSGMPLDFKDPLPTDADKPGGGGVLHVNATLFMHFGYEFFTDAKFVDEKYVELLQEIMRVMKVAQPEGLGDGDEAEVDSLFGAVVEGMSKHLGVQPNHSWKAAAKNLVLADQTLRSGEHLASIFRAVLSTICMELASFDPFSADRTLIISMAAQLGKVVASLPNVPQTVQECQDINECKRIHHLLQTAAVTENLNLAGLTHMRVRLDELELAATAMLSALVKPMSYFAVYVGPAGSGKSTSVAWMSHCLEQLLSGGRCATGSHRYDSTPGQDYHDLGTKQVWTIVNDDALKSADVEATTKQLMDLQAACGTIGFPARLANLFCAESPGRWLELKGTFWATNRKELPKEQHNVANPGAYTRRGNVLAVIRIRFEECDRDRPGFTAVGDLMPTHMYELELIAGEILDDPTVGWDAFWRATGQRRMSPKFSCPQDNDETAPAYGAVRQEFAWPGFFVNRQHAVLTTNAQFFAFWVWRMNEEQKRFSTRQEANPTIDDLRGFLGGVNPTALQLEGDPVKPYKRAELVAQGNVLDAMAVRRGQTSIMPKTGADPGDSIFAQGWTRLRANLGKVFAGAVVVAVIALGAKKLYESFSSGGTRSGQEQGKGDEYDPMARRNHGGGRRNVIKVTPRVQGQNPPAERQSLSDQGLNRANKLMNRMTFRLKLIADGREIETANATSLTHDVVMTNAHLFDRGFDYVRLENADRFIEFVPALDVSVETVRDCALLTLPSHDIHGKGISALPGAFTQLMEDDTRWNTMLNKELTRAGVLIVGNKYSTWPAEGRVARTPDWSCGAGSALRTQYLEYEVCGDMLKHPVAQVTLNSVKGYCGFTYVDKDGWIVGMHCAGPKVVGPTPACFLVPVSRKYLLEHFGDVLKTQMIMRGGLPRPAQVLGAPVVGVDEFEQQRGLPPGTIPRKIGPVVVQSVVDHTATESGALLWSQGSCKTQIAVDSKIPAAEMAAIKGVEDPRLHQQPANLRMTTSMGPFGPELREHPLEVAFTKQLQVKSAVPFVKERESRHFLTLFPKGDGTYRRPNTMEALNGNDALAPLPMATSGGPGFINKRDFLFMVTLREALQAAHDESIYGSDDVARAWQADIDAWACDYLDQNRLVRIPSRELLDDIWAIESKLRVGEIPEVILGAHLKDELRPIGKHTRPIYACSLPMTILQRKYMWYAAHLNSFRHYPEGTFALGISMQSEDFDWFNKFTFSMRSRYAESDPRLNPGEFHDALLAEGFTPEEAADIRVWAADCSSLDASANAWEMWVACEVMKQAYWSEDPEDQEDVFTHHVVLATLMKAIATAPIALTIPIGNGESYTVLLEEMTQIFSGQYATTIIDGIILKCGLARGIQEYMLHYRKVGFDLIQSVSMLFNFKDYGDDQIALLCRELGLRPCTKEEEETDPDFCYQGMWFGPTEDTEGQTALECLAACCAKFGRTLTSFDKGKLRWAVDPNQVRFLGRALAPISKRFRRSMTWLEALENKVQDLPGTLEWSTVVSIFAFGKVKEDLPTTAMRYLSGFWEAFLHGPMAYKKLRDVFLSSPASAVFTPPTFDEMKLRAPDLCQGINVAPAVRSCVSVRHVRRYDAEFPAEVDVESTGAQQPSPRQVGVTAFFGGMVGVHLLQEKFARQRLESYYQQAPHLDPAARLSDGTLPKKSDIKRLRAAAMEVARVENFKTEKGRARAIERAEKFGLKTDKRIVEEMAARRRELAALILKMDEALDNLQGDIDARENVQTESASGTDLTQIMQTDDSHPTMRTAGTTNIRSSAVVPPTQEMAATWPSPKLIEPFYTARAPDQTAKRTRMMGIPFTTSFELIATGMEANAAPLWKDPATTSSGPPRVVMYPRYELTIEVQMSPGYGTELFLVAIPPGETTPVLPTQWRHWMMSYPRRFPVTVGVNKFAFGYQNRYPGKEMDLVSGEIIGGQWSWALFSTRRQNMLLVTGGTPPSLNITFREELINPLFSQVLPASVEIELQSLGATHEAADKCKMDNMLAPTTSQPPPAPTGLLDTVGTILKGVETVGPLLAMMGNTPTVIPAPTGVIDVDRLGFSMQPGGAWPSHQAGLPTGSMDPGVTPPGQPHSHTSIAALTKEFFVAQWNPTAGGSSTFYLHPYFWGDQAGAIERDELGPEYLPFMLCDRWTYESMELQFHLASPATTITIHWVVTAPYAPDPSPTFMDAPHDQTDIAPGASFSFSIVVKYPYGKALGNTLSAHQGILPPDTTAYPRLTIFTETGLQSGGYVTARFHGLKFYDAQRAYSVGHNLLSDSVERFIQLPMGPLVCKHPITGSQTRPHPMAPGRILRPLTAIKVSTEDPSATRPKPIRPRFSLPSVPEFFDLGVARMRANTTYTVPAPRLGAADVHLESDREAGAVVGERPLRIHKVTRVLDNEDVLRDMLWQELEPLHCGKASRQKEFFMTAPRTGTAFVELTFSPAFEKSQPARVSVPLGKALEMIRLPYCNVMVIHGYTHEEVDVVDHCPLPAPLSAVATDSFWACNGSGTVLLYKNVSGLEFQLESEQNQPTKPPRVLYEGEAVAAPPLKGEITDLLQLLGPQYAGELRDVGTCGHTVWGDGTTTDRFMFHLSEGFPNPADVAGIAIKSREGPCLVMTVLPGAVQYWNLGGSVALVRRAFTTCHLVPVVELKIAPPPPTVSMIVRHIRTRRVDLATPSVALVPDVAGQAHTVSAENCTVRMAKTWNFEYPYKFTDESESANEYLPGIIIECTAAIGSPGYAPKIEVYAGLGDGSAFFDVRPMKNVSWTLATGSTEIIALESGGSHTRIAQRERLVEVELAPSSGPNRRASAIKAARTPRRADLDLRDYGDDSVLTLSRDLSQEAQERLVLQSRPAWSNQGDSFLIARQGSGAFLAACPEKQVEARSACISETDDACREADVHDNC